MNLNDHFVTLTLTLLHIICIAASLHFITCSLLPLRWLSSYEMSRKLGERQSGTQGHDLMEHRLNISPKAKVTTHSFVVGDYVQDTLWYTHKLGFVYFDHVAVGESSVSPAPGAQ